jgi:hypothetical protein
LPPLHSQSCQLCKGEPQAAHNPLKTEKGVIFSVLYYEIKLILCTTNLLLKNTAMKDSGEHAYILKKVSNL